MKGLRKLFTMLIAVVMLAGMGITTFAQDVATGAGGTGTITITNASKGKEYSVYKLFDATLGAGDAISYTVPANKVLESNNKWFAVDAAGNVSEKAAPDFTSDEFKNWAETFGTQVGTTVKAEGNQVKFTELPFGYYFVKSSLGTMLTVDSTTPDVELIDKNDTAPSVPQDGGKKIVTGANATAGETTAKIGDTVKFQITFNATNYKTENAKTTQIKKYTIEDTPTGLKIDPNSVEVNVEGAANPVAPAKKEVAADTGKMTIELTWAAMDGSTIYQSPAKVTITYSAVVTAVAKDGQATNKATITPDYEDPNTPDTPIPGGDTTIKTYQFTLKKTNGTDEINGAKFKLYDAETNGNEILLVKDGDAYRVAEAGEAGVEIEAGTVVIKGLKGDTTYWLEETHAPDGYNKLTARQKVVLGADNTLVSEVVNKKGVELPSTGGMGTTVFYVLGALLVVGAGVALISKKKMESK